MGCLGWQAEIPRAFLTTPPPGGSNSEDGKFGLDTDLSMRTRVVGVCALTADVRTGLLAGFERSDHMMVSAIGVGRNSVTVRTDPLGEGHITLAHRRPRHSLH